MTVYDFGDSISYTPTSGLTFDLEERKGEQFMLHSDEGVVLFKYRLEGDRLELEARPMDRPAGWELDHPKKWELTGKWLRLKYDTDG